MFHKVSNDFVRLLTLTLGLATSNLTLGLFLAKNFLKLYHLSISHAMRLTYKKNLDLRFF